MLAVNSVWLFFAAMTVIGSLMYNVAVKIGSEHINAFLFSTVLAAVAVVVHALVLSVYKIFFAKGEALVFDKTGLWMALIAGLGVTVIDLAFFFAVKNGSVIASQAVWVICGTLALAVVGTLFLNEAMTIGRMAGILLGMIGLYLVIRA